MLARHGYLDCRHGSQVQHVRGQTKQNRKESIMQTDIPEGPWKVVGTDLFSWNNHDYVLATDYYSRYVEIAKLDNTRSATVITSLKSCLQDMAFRLKSGVTMVHNTVRRN